MTSERRETLLQNAFSMLLDTSIACMSDDDVVSETGMSADENQYFLENSLSDNPADDNRMETLLYNAVALLLDTEYVGLTNEEIMNGIGMSDTEAEELNVFSSI
ncbi:MAG: hypothetical protein V3G42_15940 [Oscillospiraceae bacterium]